MATKKTKWLKDNLFHSPVGSLTSLILLFAAGFIFYELLKWALFDAVWRGQLKADCAEASGACWPFIQKKFVFFFFGFYPKEYLWRPILYLILSIGSIFYLFSPRNSKRRLLNFAICLVGVPLLTFLLLRGWGSFTVTPEKWGGFLLTIVLSTIGFLFSFPLGVLLALARTGKLKIIKIFATCIIEFFRGVPLITILFMVSVVLPLFFPSEAVLPKLLRLLLGLALFESAYLAEVLRGGLQAVSRGQIEAAKSLGLPWWNYTYFIALPQAIRVSLPNITSISIAFFKDTSLVLVVGWFDLLGIVKPLSSDPLWLGMEPEGYLFVGILFWLSCVAISRMGIRLEKSNKATQKLVI